MIWKGEISDHSLVLILTSNWQFQIVPMKLSETNMFLRSFSNLGFHQKLWTSSMIIWNRTDKQAMIFGSAWTLIAVILSIFFTFHLSWLSQSTGKWISGTHVEHPHFRSFIHLVFPRWSLKEYNMLETCASQL